MPDAPVAILIAGASHTGKSTLAGRIGAALNWPVLSTDGMARHPGRPWPEVRPEVAEFYDRLGDDTIHWFLRVHHQNMRPGLVRLLEDAALGNPLVLEGSALRPDLLAMLRSDRVATICLTGQADVLAARIRTATGYDGLDPGQRRLVDRFITRSQRDNDLYREEAGDLGLLSADTGNPGAVDQACTDLIAWAVARAQ